MSSVSQREHGGQRLIGGRYALLDKIGEGGLGTVWRAQDRTTNRLVAIKELTLSMAMLDSQLEVYEQRIRREVQALVRLSGHPNIVAILDQLWEAGHAWLVMEHVPGESLQQVIEREGSIPPWRAARIGVQVLDALRAAHAGGILHRDVKPATSFSPRATGPY